MGDQCAIKEFADHNVGSWHIIISYFWHETQNKGAYTPFVYLHNLGIACTCALCAKSAFPCAKCLQVAKSLPPNLS